MKQKLFTLAMAVTMLAACSNNDDVVPEVDHTKDTPIPIAAAGVAELTTRVITEGDLIGAMDEPVSISVWVEGSAEKYNADNVEWVHNGECWSAESQTLFEGTNSEQEI